MSLAFDYSIMKDPVIRDSPGVNYDEIIEALPIVEDTEKHFALCTNGVIEYQYNKDRTQRPLFCHVMECVPTAADYGNLVIGSAFCRDNNLVHENGNGLQGLKLVVSHSKTIDDDDEWIPDGFSGDYPVINYFSVHTESKGAAARLEYNYRLIDDGITAWAIVNASGEIFIAANGAPRTIYAWIMDFPK